MIFQLFQSYKSLLEFVQQLTLKTTIIMYFYFFDFNNGPNENKWERGLSW